MAVFLIDDNQTNLVLMTQLVNQIEGAEALPFLDPLDALKRMGEVEVDLIVVDYLMPRMDGLHLIGHVRRHNRLFEVPIVMVTTAEQRSVRLAALDAGATDFLSKPIDPAEFRARIRNLLKISKAQSALRDKAHWLAGEVARVAAHLAVGGEALVARMQMIARMPDPDTGTTRERMGAYCRLIAEGLELPAVYCRNLALAAPLHDCKGIELPHEGAGTGVVRLGAGAGFVPHATPLDMPSVALSSLALPQAHDLVRLVAEIVLSHHERWDGTGYPLGLKGESIALGGRIAAVAGVFDALTSPRLYKRVWSFDEARRWISDKSGTHFDPRCVQAFLARWDDILAVGAVADENRGVA